MNLRQTGKRRNIRSLLGFELFLKTACLSFSFPFFRWTFDFCLWAAGFSYVTKENFAEFILSPCVLLCFAVGIALVDFLVVLEANAVCLVVQREKEGIQITTSELFLECLEETGCLFRKLRRGIGLALRCGSFVLVVNLPILLFLAFGLCLAGDTSATANSVIGLLLLGVGATGAAGLILLDRRRVLYGMLKRGFVLLLTEGVVYLIGLLVCVVPVLYSTMPAVSGVLALRVFERFHLIAGSFFVSVNTVVFEYFCTELLLRDRKGTVYKRSQSVQRLQNRQMKQICLSFAYVIVGIMTVTQTVAFFRNKSVLLSETLEKICITAHRGASEYAPENTMASIALAVEEGADYVELDVRLTADEVPVLLHDSTLSRTTGVSKAVEQVTYEDLTAYDAGSSFSDNYAGEKIPSLEEVLKAYGGKVGFNIELKDKKSRSLVHLVVALIEKYGVEESCVVTSMSYEQLEWVKEKNKTIKTGYILSMVYGDFYECRAADFLSIRSGFVTETVVKEAHALGKEVHAWTVNKENEFIRLKAIGIDNIITDKPAYAREIVQRSFLAETLGAWATFFVSEK